MKTYAKLVRIDHNRPIMKSTDSEFLFLQQRAVLLALKDNGTLTELQYRYAEEKLAEQYQSFVRSLIEGSSTG